MRIGLNLLYLIPGVVGGMEIYADSLLRSIAALDSQNDYVVYLNREGHEFRPVANRRWTYHVCDFSAQSRATRYYWEQLRLPAQVHQDHIDVLHSLGYVGPINIACRHVLTLPDLNYRILGKSLSFTRRHALRFFSEQAARTADHVVTLSYFSKQQILDYLKLPAGKVTVTWLGAKEHLALPNEAARASSLARYGLNPPYVMAFGGGALHKNIPRLLEAFARVKDTVPHNLALVGAVPANVALPDDAVRLGIDRRLVTTGYVPNSDVLPLLAGADVYVLPSTYEGFGLPILEAQQVGVAIASSSAGSLPEIGGSGARYFDPCSVDDIAKVIAECLASPVLRQELIANGRRNLERFSWQTTAQQTLDVYRAVYTGQNQAPNL